MEARKRDAQEKGVVRVRYGREHNSGALLIWSAREKDRGRENKSRPRGGNWGLMRRHKEQRGNEEKGTPRKKKTVEKRQNLHGPAQGGRRTKGVSFRITGRWRKDPQKEKLWAHTSKAQEILGRGEGLKRIKGEEISEFRENLYLKARGRKKKEGTEGRSLSRNPSSLSSVLRGGDYRVRGGRGFEGR